MSASAIRLRPSESLAGGLLGNAQGQGDVIPSPATSPGYLDRLLESSLVHSSCFCCGRDRPEVFGVVDVGGRRVQFVGELLEALGGPLDVIVGYAAVLGRVADRL